MGKKVRGLWFIVCGFIFLLVNNCCAQPISSTELINNAKLYDEKTVAYAGEVIGDVMARGEFSWVNLNDGQNAIGIWMLERLSKEIFYSGSYKARGDIIEVVGVFHRACPEHGGDLDIHAQGLRKISPGRELAEKLNTSKKNFALVLLGILCLVLILRRLIKP
jgi:hypothetical protein